MNWAAISVICGVLLAIGAGIGNLVKGISKKYFDILEANQKDTQGRLQVIELLVKGLDVNQNQFVNIEKVQIKIDSAKDEIYGEIANLETRTDKKIDEINKKLDKHLDKAS